MKFKEIIADLPEDKKIMLKKWRKELLIICSILFFAYAGLGLLCGYIQWGLPEPTVSLVGTNYSCKDVTDSIKGIGQRMVETGTLPPAHLLEELETLELKLKC